MPAPAAPTRSARPASATARNGSSKTRPAGEVVRTIAFDSAGPRKYALQIRRAANGNPCLKIVEGVPQGDGTFRKFHLTIWSEDFDRFFENLDAIREFMREKDIRTPDGHKYEPDRKRFFARKGKS